MNCRFYLLPDEIIEKIYLMSHCILMKNIVKEIMLKDKVKDFSEEKKINNQIFRYILHTQDGRFLKQNGTFYIMNPNPNIWQNFDKKTHMLFVNYWLNNITLCKYIFTKEHMLSIFNFIPNIVTYIKKIIYNKTNDNKKPLQQFHNIYLKKIGYNDKYLNTWKKAIEILWCI